MAKPSIPSVPNLEHEVEACRVRPCFRPNWLARYMGKHLAVGAVDLAHDLFGHVPCLTAICEDAAYSPTKYIFQRLSHPPFANIDCLVRLEER